jgi:hypothetical protein
MARTLAEPPDHATEAPANRPISVFKELHEARRWLDSSD